MRLKESPLCCVFAWSPKRLGTPPLIAAASYFGAMDDDFNSEPFLEIRLVDVTQTDQTDMPVLGRVSLPARGCRIDWSAHPIAPHGVIAVGCENGMVYLFSATAILQSGQSNEDYTGADARAHPTTPPHATEDTRRSQASHAAAQALLATIKAHRGLVRGCQFNTSKPDVLATGDEDGKWFVWNLKSATSNTSTNNAHTSPHNTPTRHAQQQQQQQQTSAPALEISKICVIESHHSSPIVDLQWHPKYAHILATAHSSNVINAWNLKTTSLATSLNLAKSCRGATVTAIAWNPTEATQLVVGLDSTHPVLQLWDLKCTMAPRWESRAGTNSGGGESGEDAGAVGGERDGAPAPHRGVSALAWNAHDPSELASAGEDGVTQCWEPTTGRRVSALRAERVPVVGVQWCPAVPHVLATSSYAPALCVSTADEEAVSGWWGEEETTRMHHMQAGGRAAAEEREGGAHGVAGTGAAGMGVRGAGTGSSVATMDRGARVLRRGSGGGGTAPHWLRRPCGASINFALQVVMAAPKSADAANSEGEKGGGNAAANATTTTLRMAALPLDPTSPRTRDELTQNAELQQLAGHAAAQRASWLERHHYGLLSAVAAAQESRQPILNFLREGSAAGGVSGGGYGEEDESGGRRSGSAAHVNHNNNNSISDDDPFAALTHEQQKSYEERAAEEVARGRLEVAVDLCIDQGRFDDAFAIAYLAGAHLVTRVHQQYLAHVRATHTERRHVLLAGAISSGDYAQLIAADVPWRTALSAIVAFVGDGFAEACNALGDALHERDDMEGAYTCYVCARNVDAVVRLWQEQGHSPRQVVQDAVVLEQVTERAITSDFYAHSLYLYGLKFVLEGHMREGMGFLQRAAAMGGLMAHILVDRMRSLEPAGAAGGAPFAVEPISQQPSPACQHLLQEMAAMQQQQQMRMMQQEQEQMQQQQQQQQQQMQQHQQPMQYANMMHTQQQQQQSHHNTNHMVPPPLHQQQQGQQRPALPPPPQTPLGQTQPSMYHNAHASNATPPAGALPPPRQQQPPARYLPAAVTTTPLARSVPPPPPPGHHTQPPPHNQTGYAPPPPAPSMLPTRSSSAGTAPSTQPPMPSGAPPHMNGLGPHAPPPPPRSIPPSSPVMTAVGGAGEAYRAAMPSVPPPHGFSLSRAPSMPHTQPNLPSSALPNGGTSARPMSNGLVAPASGGGTAMPTNMRLMPHPVSGYSALRHTGGGTTAAAQPPPPPPAQMMMMRADGEGGDGVSSYASANRTAAAAPLPPPPLPSSSSSSPPAPGGGYMRGASQPPTSAYHATTPYRDPTQGAPLPYGAAPPQTPAPEGRVNSAAYPSQQPPPMHRNATADSMNMPTAPSYDDSFIGESQAGSTSESSSLAPQLRRASAAARPLVGMEGAKSILAVNPDALQSRGPMAKQIVTLLQQHTARVGDSRKRVAIDQSAIELYRQLEQGVVPDNLQSTLLHYLSTIGTAESRNAWTQLSQRNFNAIRGFINLRFL